MIINCRLFIPSPPPHLCIIAYNSIMPDDGTGGVLSLSFHLGSHSLWFIRGNVGDLLLLLLLIYPTNPISLSILLLVLRTLCVCVFFLLLCRRATDRLLCCDCFTQQSSSLERRAGHNCTNAAPTKADHHRSPVTIHIDCNPFRLESEKV